MAVSFAVGVQLARALGASGYGYYGMALAIISIAGVPGEMGLPRLVTREIAAAGARKDLGMIFGVLRWADSMSWRISALVMIGVVIADLIISPGSLSALETAMLFGAPIIPLLTLARIRGGALQGLQYVVRGQIPDVLLRPMVLSVLIFAVLLSGATFSPAVAMGLNSIAAAVAFIVAHRWLKERLPQRPAEMTKAGRHWLASSVPMGLTDGMRIIQSEVSVLLVGFIAAPFDAGVFRIANVTSFMAATPVAIINFVAFPVIARLYAEKNIPQLQRVLTRLAQAQFVGVLLLCLPLLIAPHFLLNLIFGHEFATAGRSLRILTAAQLITSAFGLNAAVLNMTGHERRVTRAMVIALIFNLTALPIMTYLWGRPGAASALATALIIWNVLTWWDARRLLGVETSVLSFKWFGEAGLSRGDLAGLATDDPSPRFAKPRLANLFIVGAPKCGTTAWFKYLNAHRQIFFSKVKEPTHFAPDLPGMRYVKSRREFELLFARARDATILGDASATHLFSKTAAREIARYNPHAKIMIFVRDQENFLPSLHHHFLARYEEEFEDFETAWRLSSNRPPETIPRTCTEPKLLDYAALASFHEQVARYYAEFPPEQIRVIRFEDWTANPRETYLRILDFLGVEDDGRTSFPPINEARHYRVKWLGRLITHPPRQFEVIARLIRKITGRPALGIAEWASEIFSTPGYRTRLPDDLRAEIRRYYEEDNRKLETLLRAMDQSGSRRPI